MPAYDEYFLDIAWSGGLDSLVELCIDLAPNGRQDIDIGTVTLPALKYLAVIGTYIIQPLIAAHAWVLPSLKYLVCMSASGLPEPNLVPALRNFGKSLHRLSLRGTYPRNLHLDLARLCPSLEFLEVDSTNVSVVINAHPSLRELHFTGAETPYPWRDSWEAF